MDLYSICTFFPRSYHEITGNDDLPWSFWTLRFRRRIHEIKFPKYPSSLFSVSNVCCTPLTDKTPPTKNVFLSVKFIMNFSLPENKFFEFCLSKVFGQSEILRSKQSLDEKQKQKLKNNSQQKYSSINYRENGEWHFYRFPSLVPSPFRMSPRSI